MTLAAAVSLALLFPGAVATADVPPVDLGLAGKYAVLAGTVTDTGSSVVSGNVGVTAATNLPPELAADTAQAREDLTTAYAAAAGLTSTAIPADIGGHTLRPGVYEAPAELQVSGTLTLDAQSDPDAVFVIQAKSTLLTVAESIIHLIGGANPCNVYWQVGGSVTLGAASAFVGTVMAQTSVTLQTGATVSGRVLVRDGQVKLSANVVTRPLCAAPATIPVPTTPVPTTPVPTTPVPTTPVPTVTETTVPEPTTPEPTIPEPAEIPAVAELPAVDVLPAVPEEVVPEGLPAPEELPLEGLPVPEELPVPEGLPAPEEQLPVVEDYSVSGEFAEVPVDAGLPEAPLGMDLPMVDVVIGSAGAGIGCMPLSI